MAQRGELATRLLNWIQLQAKISKRSAFCVICYEHVLLQTCLVEVILSHSGQKFAITDSNDGGCSLSIWQLIHRKYGVGGSLTRIRAVYC